MDRRDFQKLAMAALGGALAGASLVRADDKDKPKAKTADKSVWLQEPHVCRGLNTCKNKGKSEKNDCAGQGTCATAEAHSCGGENGCRGLGGCGAEPAENACKGKGQCHVPPKDDSWKKARKRFEEALTKAEKKFGDAPAKK